ncbi:hypothetical protein [Streptomyces nigrescens]|uniref:Uncharacterized protein n=1 Tax=Streptomyces nigrescens TaxID=1920 RepID=A0A640T8I0_STRNI|nr:hypothetical protein [Streptomyces libani]WAT94896.1 hypothetical protein STRLI_000568 [Streptomyces libani subsp. libani]GFE20043.1 hypothetical protein Sliba_04960 [Streptomyces libani subsp. libani]GGV85652.1 hypothetical protein GCM10010500_02490 [Streptomyces libani subsp. libani]
MNDTAADYSWPACGACGRPLWENELGRQACRMCQRRVDDNLQSLAGSQGLYAALSAALVPGAGNGEARVSGGTRTAPLPLRLEPLSLSSRGGVVTVLQTWLVDWHEQLQWAHPRWQGDLQQQLDQVVQALRTNLEWAASQHPAFGDFSAEVAALVRSCHRQATGEKPERRIVVACPCGSTLRVTISTPGARCAGCGTQYTRADVLELPLATHGMAA